MDILKDLPHGDARNKAGNIPVEYFANPESVKEHCVYDGTQISPGVLGDQMIGTHTEQGFVTIAGAGGGKSTTVTANLIHYQGSVAIIDPKNDFAENTAVWRAEELEQDVNILAAGIEASEHLHQYLSTWNPLERLEIDSDTLLEDIGLIGDALIIPSQKGESFWTDSAQSFLEAVIAHVISCPLYEKKKDLVTVSQLISQGKNL